MGSYAGCHCTTGAVVANTKQGRFLVVQTTLATNGDYQWLLCTPADVFLVGDDVLEQNAQKFLALAEGRVTPHLHVNKQ